MKRLAALLLFALGLSLPSPVPAQFNGCLPGFCVQTASAPASCGVTTTLDPTSNANGTIALSNGNLTATSISIVSGGSRVDPNIGQYNSGKFYFEYTVVNDASGPDTGVGVGTPNSYTTQMGDNARYGVFLKSLSGNINTSTVYSGSTLGSLANGNVIGVAIDLDNRKAWFRINPSGNWNGSGTANPATNTGGVTIQSGFMAPIFNSSLGGEVYTFNFGGQAMVNSPPTGFTCGWPASCTNSGHAAAFLARTSSLDATHIAAYTTLLDGMDSDNIACKFDMLHIYATQNTTTAQLNLMSSSYSAVLNGSPTFTADRGYTGVANSSTVYINTQYNPISVNGRYQQDFAHLSLWANNSAADASGGVAMGHQLSGFSNYSWIIPRITGDAANIRINATSGTGNFTSTDAKGLWVGTIYNVECCQHMYHYAIEQSNDTLHNSTTPSNNNMYVLAGNINGTAGQGSGNQISMASIGGYLYAADIRNFGMGVCRYLTKVGAPTAATTFLARTTSLDAAHVTAYTNLICGLELDGLWPSLDVLYIYATQDATNAVLNLISSSFTAIPNGSPTFTADRGYTGVDASTTVYINTQYNPLGVGGFNYTQDNAHMSLWANSNLTGGIAAGTYSSGTGAYIQPKSTVDNLAHIAINGVEQTFANTNSIGHYTGIRVGSGTQTVYKNAVQQVTGGSGVGTPSTTFYNLGLQFGGGSQQGSPHQVSAFSAGGTLTATRVGYLYNNLRTYMTAVGVP